VDEFFHHDSHTYIFILTVAECLIDGK
jgi:hypothetical protein